MVLDEMEDEDPFAVDDEYLDFYDDASFFIPDEQPRPDLFAPPI